MLSCTRRLQWCMGHRLVGHEGHCAVLHGHNYVGLFTAEADVSCFRLEKKGRPEELDAVGRVVDFAVLKERVGGWIEDAWDHGFVLNAEDAPGRAALEAFDSVQSVTLSGLPRQKLFLLSCNPTAENLARLLLEDVCPRVLEGTGVVVTRVQLWETENCYAEAAL